MTEETKSNPQRLREELQKVLDKHKAIKGETSFPSEVAKDIANAIQTAMGYKPGASEQVVLDALSWFVFRSWVRCIFYFDLSTPFRFRYIPCSIQERNTGQWDVAILSCGTIVKKWKGQHNDKKRKH